MHPPKLPNPTLIWYKLNLLITTISWKFFEEIACIQWTSPQSIIAHHQKKKTHPFSHTAFFCMFKREREREYLKYVEESLSSSKAASIEGCINGYLKCESLHKRLRPNALSWSRPSPGRRRLKPTAAAAGRRRWWWCRHMWWIAIRCNWRNRKKRGYKMKTK